jgi:hypothetical protein
VARSARAGFAQEAGRAWDATQRRCGAAWAATKRGWAATRRGAAAAAVAIWHGARAAWAFLRRSGRAVGLAVAAAVVAAGAAIARAGRAGRRRARADAQWVAGSAASAGRRLQPQPQALDGHGPDGHDIHDDHHGFDDPDEFDDHPIPPAGVPPVPVPPSGGDGATVGVRAVPRTATPARRRGPGRGGATRPRAAAVPAVAAAPTLPTGTRTREGVVVPLRVPLRSRLKAGIGLVLLSTLLGVGMAVLIGVAILAAIQVLSGF